jgi:outer membrane biosynthesis protein TonB
MSDFLHEERDEATPAAWAVRAVLLAAAALLAWLAFSRLASGDAGPAPPMTHRVTLVNDVPPPPPPERPEPEPVTIEEPMETMEVEAPPEDPVPQLDQLGVLGEGVAGGDAFGLRSRQDGIDAFRALREGGGGGSGLAHRLWSDEVGNALRADLQDYPQLRRANYRVQLEMRFGENGRVQRCDLLDSTGDSALDTLIETRCAALALHQPPPADLPQPLRLAVNVYGAR